VGYGEYSHAAHVALTASRSATPEVFAQRGCHPLMEPREVVRDVRHLVRDLGLRAIRLEPYMYGDGTVGLPPNDKRYWPVYLECAELGIPVCIQVGHTGPLLPSECGRPIYLDEVALAFPELTLVGCHLGQPWHEEMLTLAWKHPNVYVETSARTPRHWPASFVEFARGWGQDKVLWATDYPLLPFERTLEELDALGLPEGVRRKVLRDNAARVFGLAVGVPAVAKGGPA
jgi:predicted TIM-barrel fold metal-dependent hydrolase